MIIVAVDVGGHRHKQTVTKNILQLFNCSPFNRTALISLNLYDRDSLALLLELFYDYLLFI